MRWRIMVAMGLVVLAGAIAIAISNWPPLSAQSTDWLSTGKQIVPILAKQLTIDNEIVPVEIQCERLVLNKPGTLEGLSCHLVNGTKKRIRAASLTLAVVVESDGVESKESFRHTIDTFIHKDFNDSSKAIGPAQSSPFGPAGPLQFSGSNIHRVEIELDYLEFTDNSVNGSSEIARQTIQGIRAGAALFRGWLEKAYKELGESPSAIASSLEASEVPEKLRNESPEVLRGIRAYQSLLRTRVRKEGPNYIKKILNE